MGRSPKMLFLIFLFLLWLPQIRSQESKPNMHHVLFLGSYALTYTWSDSLVSGVNSIFSLRDDINLYIEFLDAKRFYQHNFPDLFRLYKKKYSRIDFDVVIASDNDAIDFLMAYGDSLFPDIPVVFCGINNAEDYPFENSRYYGIIDGIDLKAEINLIAQVMPEVHKLYFISDSATTTSLINLGYVVRLEPQFANRFEFSYLCNMAPDSIIQKVSKLEKGSAIALINVYQDTKGKPINPEAINLQITHASPVPIFMESETLLGKGIAGGIIINGRTHGRDVARLALRFIDSAGYHPDERVIRPDNRYYFDYNMLKKFNISEANLPPHSVIINKPHQAFLKYIKYISALLGIIGLLIVIVLLLILNIRKRRRAEELVQQNLVEISDKNIMLEQAHKQVNEMNTELEEINEHLSATNEELVKAKMKSEESDRLKSAFLANMSHEIRTPLNAIVGFSSLMNDEQLRPADREQYYRIINSNSNQLLHIIEDILDLSKIEAGQLKTNVEVFPVNEIMNELYDSFHKGNTNKQVRILLSIPDERKQVMLKSDPGRFKQILTNLLSNAIKFTNKGSIELGYDLVSKNNITFYVRDTGIGIDERDLQNIFNRFWKAESEGGTFHAGTGLGLSICKSLCEALKGSIRAESNYGKGSTFYVTLHDYFIKAEEPSGYDVPLSDFISYNWDHITIAVAEDEESNLYLLNRILNNLKVKLVTFQNGLEIVDFVRRNHTNIDLILMDLKMPVMDGYTATRLIREINANIPIVAQTAYAMIEDIEKIKEAAFNDYIVKPIKPGLLVEKIKKLIFPE